MKLRIIGRLQKYLSAFFLLLLCIVSVQADHNLMDNPLEIRPHDSFAALPLRLCMEIMQEGSNTFQIYAASQSKRNPWHWELFTMPNSNELTVYMPGFKPAQVGFGRSIADAKYHTIIMMFEEKRIRLFVDGEFVREHTILSIPSAPAKVTEPFYFGKIDNLSCQGTLRRAKLEHRVSDDGAINWTVDDTTVGLWNCEKAPEKGIFKDLSGHGHDARITNSEEIKMLESKKQAPLPLEDTTAIRRETEEWLADHQLPKKLFPKLSARDVVWDQWRFNLQNHGKVDYAAERAAFHYRMLKKYTRR